MTDSDELPTDDNDLEAALREATSSTDVEAARSHALTDREASRLAATRRPTVVVLAGTVSSGKTTLITSIYERFGRGPIGPTSFAGSTTLPGFEARARGLRPQVGVKPPMPHTHRDAVPWLHLRILGPTPPAFDVLFGDFDGEVFDRVVEGKDAPESVPALTRADHLSVVIDAEALVSGLDRPLATQRAIDLINVVSTTGVAASPAALSIVLTKLDLLNRASSDDRRAARRTLETIRSHLASRIATTSPPVFETAAISDHSELPLGHGVDELLTMWYRAQSTPVARDPVSAPPLLSHDWFGRFGL